VILGFCHEAEENCGLLGYYTANSGNFLLMFWDNLLVPTELVGLHININKMKGMRVNTYTTIILPVVLYGCESWSLTLREERRLRVFEKGVLRRISGPKRDEVMG
jgi:hypothetical protein